MKIGLLKKWSHRTNFDEKFGQGGLRYLVLPNKMQVFNEGSTQEESGHNGMMKSW